MGAGNLANSADFVFYSRSSHSLLRLRLSISCSRFCSLNFAGAAVFEDQVRMSMPDVLILGMYVSASLAGIDTFGMLHRTRFEDGSAPKIGVWRGNAAPRGWSFGGEIDGFVRGWIFSSMFHVALVFGRSRRPRPMVGICRPSSTVGGFVRRWISLVEFPRSTTCLRVEIFSSKLYGLLVLGR